MTQGKVALVADEMFEHLNQWKWRAKKDTRTYYARRDIRVDNKQVTIQMHHVIWELLHPEYVGKKYKIDHIDGNSWNNQPDNLRAASTAENGMNSRKPENCSSEYKGVTWSKRASKWLAQIVGVNHRKIYLGLFDDEIEAAHTYDRAAIKYFGEFAKLNFPRENYGL